MFKQILRDIELTNLKVRTRLMPLHLHTTHPDKLKQTSKQTNKCSLSVITLHDVQANEHADEQPGEAVQRIQINRDVATDDIYDYPTTKNFKNEL